MLLVETHDDWVAAPLLRRLMEAVANPAVGILWDVHHPYRAGGEEPETTCTEHNRRAPPPRRCSARSTARPRAEAAP